MCRQSLGATNKALSKFHILAKEPSRQCRFLALRNQHRANRSQVIEYSLAVNKQTAKVITIAATASAVVTSWHEEELL